MPPRFFAGAIISYDEKLPFYFVFQLILLGKELSSVGEVHKRLSERHGNGFSSAEYF